MTLELLVLTGSRAGANLSFDKHEVTVGRHGSSDLRFDPTGDLDVSTRHAELRELNGTWTVVDEASTNGTYVNGVRVPGSKVIRDGDIINFGVNGPRVEVKSGAGPRLSSATPPGTMIASARPSPPRLDTNVRVAIAVKEQTSGMKMMFGAALAALVILAGAGFVYTQRQSSARDAEYASSLARGDSAIAALQKTISSMRPSDSTSTQALMAELDRQKQALATARTQIAKGGDSKSSMEQLSKSMAPMITVGQMDVPKIVGANDAAVAFLVSDLDGTPMGGTAFGITSSGLLVTNRHVVRTEAGAPAKRIAVLFANTSKWKGAHIVRVSDGDDDLALIQIDEPGVRPTVNGISKSGSHAVVGSPVVTIGYPLSNDTPMEGDGLSNMTARTTTTLGTVSKRLDNILQLDSFSAHGASGSPVFDAEGNVVGVIYGGARESGGRIVYCVPVQRLIAFLGKDADSILK